jgi:hypothetical protein
MFLIAVRTGLEPATHGVTGRYSNQLNYRTNFSNVKADILIPIYRETTAPFIALQN